MGRFLGLELIFTSGGSDFGGVGVIGVGVKVDGRIWVIGEDKLG